MERYKPGVKIEENYYFQLEYREEKFKKREQMKGEKITKREPKM